MSAVPGLGNIGAIAAAAPGVCLPTTLGSALVPINTHVIVLATVGIERNQLRVLCELGGFVNVAVQW